MFSGVADSQPTLGLILSMSTGSCHFVGKVHTVSVVWIQFMCAVCLPVPQCLMWESGWLLGGVQCPGCVVKVCFICHPTVAVIRIIT